MVHLRWKQNSQLNNQGSGQTVLLGLLQGRRFPAHFSDQIVSIQLKIFKLFKNQILWPSMAVSIEFPFIEFYRK